MLKICFVNSIILETNDYDLPLGILSLATILKSKSYDVSIIDFNYLWSKEICKKDKSLKNNISIMGDYILSYNPDVVDFYTMCNSYHITIILSKYLKEKNPNIKIVFGGPQASLTAEKSLEAFPWIDIIGIGEGEQIIERLFKAIENNEDFSHINGIAYKKNGKIIRTLEPNLILDLDKLPFIDYSLVNIADYSKIPIDAGRGCPFGCVYCSTKVFWKRKFRLKSSKRLIDEINYLKTNYGKENFKFVHDLFTVNKIKVTDFCNLIISENININWDCSARIDTLDEEVMSKMKLAGCTSIFLGIETGSQRMQKLISKKLNLDTIWDKIDTLKKYGFKVTLSFIYGFPDETVDDIRETLNMIRIAIENNIENVQLHICTFLAGTEMYEIHKNNLIYEEFYSSISHCSNLKECEDLIINNPDIFPHFYFLKTELRDKFKFLDQFIYTLSILYKNNKQKFKTLCSIYKNDLYKMFLEFNEFAPEFDNNFKEYYYTNKTNRDSILDKMYLNWKSLKLLTEFCDNLELNLENLKTQ